MPSQRNISSLDEAKQKVDKSTAMYFVEYTGLTHKQLEEARQELGKANAEMAVVKNTLMNIALTSKKIDAKEKLTGQKAILFSYEDPIQTAKVLAAFIKKYGLPKVSFGVYNDEIIDEAMIGKLATLPSKEILVGKLLGLLNSPISGLVYVLNGNITKLALVLKEIEKKKASTSKPAAAPAAPAVEEVAAAPAAEVAAEAPAAAASEAESTQTLEAEVAVEAPVADESAAETKPAEEAPAETQATEETVTEAAAEVEAAKE